MPVELSQQQNIGIITLNRPEALNALSFDILQEIGNAIEEAGQLPIRALLFMGAGDRAFCAGADIAELAGRPMMEARDGARLGQTVFAKLDALTVPSIAILNGYAFGGGLELALACTFRLAVPSAKMGQPEIKLGLIPGYGGTQRLPRLIGEGRALDLIMTGRSVGAEEAYRIGLVTRLIEGDPLQAGLDFAAEFSNYSLPVLQLAREAVQRAATLPISEGLRLEADLSTLAFQSEDAEEGLAAFLDKRRPAFKDR